MKNSVKNKYAVLFVSACEHDQIIIKLQVHTYMKK